MTKILVLALFLFGEEIKTPTITDAHKAQYFRTQLALRLANEQAQKASYEADQAINVITKDCADLKPKVAEDGDIICAIKPK